jgi:spoIIIJ-associated protein
MFRPSETEKIKEKVRKFFSFLDVDSPIKFEEINSDTIKISFWVEEAPFFIGERGETLVETQNLIKKILAKETGRHLFIDLDINNYKEKKAKYLEDLARTAADQAALTKKPQALKPMWAWERRIIHSALAERQDVYSQSSGRGHQRHIVIYPAS